MILGHNNIWLSERVLYHSAKKLISGENYANTLGTSLVFPRQISHIKMDKRFAVYSHGIVNMSRFAELIISKPKRNGNPDNAIRKLWHILRAKRGRIFIFSLDSIYEIYSYTRMYYEGDIFC